MQNIYRLPSYINKYLVYIFRLKEDISSGVGVALSAGMGGGGGGGLIGGEKRYQIKYARKRSYI